MKQKIYSLDTVLARRCEHQSAVYIEIHEHRNAVATTLKWHFTKTLLFLLFFCKIGFSSSEDPHTKLCFQDVERTPYALSYRSGDDSAQSLVEEHFLKIAKILKKTNFERSLILIGPFESPYLIFAQNQSNQRYHYRVAYLSKKSDRKSFRAFDLVTGDEIKYP